MLPSPGFDRARRSFRALPDIGPWIGDESVTIRHRDSRQGRGVPNLLLANDTVAVQEVGGHRIDLVGREGARVVEGLRPADVAPERGSILPEASDGLNGLVGRQRALAADQTAVGRVLARRPVAGGALGREDRLAECSGPFPWR